MILSAVDKCHECEYKTCLGYCEVDKNACEFHKFDSCANCCHCAKVYDNSEFCYYYCLCNDCRLDSLNHWCGGFSGVNPKLLIERPVLPIAYIIEKQRKADMEAMMTPSMDYHNGNESVESMQRLLASIRERYITGETRKKCGMYEVIDLQDKENK